MEPDINALIERPYEGEAFDAPVNILVTCYRSRLADADANSVKWCLDAIVSAGVLRDDTPKEIAEIRYRQIKVASKTEERTTLEIVKADDAAPHET